MHSHFQENFKSPANASLHVQGQAPILLVPWCPAVQRAEMHSMFSIQRRYMFFIIVLSHRAPIRHQANTSSAEDSPEYSHHRDGCMRCYEVAWLRSRSKICYLQFSFASYGFRHEILTALLAFCDKQRAQRRCHSNFRPVC